MFHKLIKGIAPIAAIALGAALAGCNDMNISIDGEEGVPLAELDMSGEAPTELVLAGPDLVVVTDGTALDIDVSGDAKAMELVRFTLKDGTLGVLRAKGTTKDTGKAVVTVTMPSPKSLTIAGSGTIEAESMAANADINILGAGSLKVAAMKSTRADVTVAGSGMMEAAGTTDRLDLNIMGSGKAEMAGLSVAEADVTVAGSGDAAFASDGKVKANIMGSGLVRVIGRATCEVSSMGSGKVVCEARDEAAAKPKETAAAEPKAAKQAKGKAAKLAGKKSARDKSRKA